MANADSVKETVGGKPERQESAIGGAIAEVGGWPQRTKTFLSEVRAELKRVSWPTWTQVKATTVVVLVTVAFFAVFFGVLDRLFTYSVELLLNYGR